MLRSSKGPPEPDPRPTATQAPVLKMKLQEVVRQILKYPIMLLLLPVLLAVRLLRPLVLVRFGYLRADRIGEFTFHTEVFLCGKDLGMHGRRTLDIFYCRSLISTHFLKKMWQRTIHVYQFAGWLDRLNRWVPGGKAHAIPIGQQPF